MKVLWLDLQMLINIWTRVPVMSFYLQLYSER